MSEKDNTDEAAQTENQSSLNRRRFVKALGTTGVASVGLSSAVAGKRNTNSGEPVGLSQGKTMKAFGHAMSGQATNQLKKYLTDDGYQQDPSDVTAVAVESDKPELNNGNPVSVFIPFKGKQGDLDKTGFINVLVVDAEPNGRSEKRVPVAAFGLSSEPSRGSSAELEQMPDDGVTHHVEYFSWNGETEQVATAGKQDFTKSDVIEAYDQVAGSQDQISTQGFFDPPLYWKHSLCWRVSTACTSHLRAGWERCEHLHLLADLSIDIWSRTDWLCRMQRGLCCDH